jgi:SAM-dependent methyltransferase
VRQLSLASPDGRRRKQKRERNLNEKVKLMQTEIPPLIPPWKKTNLPDYRAPLAPHELQQAFAQDSAEHDGPTLSEAGAKVRKVRKLFRTLIHPVRHTRILDVGCADGSVLYPFVSESTELHGIDVSAAYLQTAAQRGYRVTQANIDGAPLPYKNYFFDLVYAGDVLEHVVDTDWALAQINRVMVHSGRLVLTIPNVRTPASLAAMVLLGIPPVGSARYRSCHFRDFTLRTIKIALSNNGFKIEKAIGADFGVPFVGGCFERLANVLPSWAWQIIIVARKLTNTSYTREKVTDRDIYNRGEK